MLLEPIKNKLDKNTPFYGVDLGTTYTVIASIDPANIIAGMNYLPVKIMTINQKSPLPLDGSEASDMVASILAVDDEKRMYVGNKLYRLKGNPMFIKDKNLFYHWKLDLGVSIKPLYPNAIRPDVDDASKVAGKILNYCRININKDKEWENVIITVPASFQANQRTDVLTAAQYANIKVSTNMLVDEPNAAFLGYVNQLSDNEKQTFSKDREITVLVIDFGGGTCDLSILNVNPVVGGLKIANLAISRYNNLGGQDIDLLLAEGTVLRQFSELYDNFDANDLEKQIIPQLAVIAEKLKIDLSRTISAVFQDAKNIDKEKLCQLKSVINDQVIVVNDEEIYIQQVTLRGDELYETIKFLFLSEEYKLELTDKVIQSVPSTISDTLQKANLAKTDIDYVLMAGGSVQNLLFVDQVSEILPESKVLLPQRPDTLVAQGAAIISFYRNALNFDPIQPISSETIGVVTSNASFFPLIKAGTPLPAKIDIPAFTLQDIFQTRVVVPLCMSNSDEIVQTLEIDLPDDFDINQTLTIHAELTAEKVFSATLLSGNQILGEMEVINPFSLANISPLERVLAQKIQELERVKASRDRNKESEIMRSLVEEYYNLDNYSKAASVGEEWIKKFGVNDTNIYNLIYCAYSALGQRRKAEHYLDKALSLKPNNSVLCYNKSLVIENEEGSLAALEFLKSKPEDVQSSRSVTLRMALLGLKENEPEAAEIVKAKYLKGAYYNYSRFDLNILKEILMYMGVEYKEPEIHFVEDIKIGFNAYKGDLLKVKGDLDIL